jgi:hypothetical protein
MFRKDRQSTHRGGGIIVYVSDTLKCARRDDLEQWDVEALWVEVRFYRMNLWNCNVYRPPNSLASWSDSFSDLLEVAANENHNKLILGDFN